MLYLINYIRPWARYLLIIWILAIVTVSSSPGIPTLKIHTQKAEIRIDYLLHIIEYGSLVFLALLTFSGKDFSVSVRRAATIVAAILLFAFADEFHQKLVPGRSYNIYDFVSNAAGTLAGWLVSIILFRLVKKKFYP
jgi:VanZ family protein